MQVKPTLYRWISHDYSKRFVLFGLDRGVRLVVGFLLGAAIARFLGPSGFGLLTYITAFVVLIGVACSFGLDSLLVRDLVQKVSNEHSIVGTACLVRAGLGIVGFLGCGVYAWNSVGNKRLMASLLLLQSITLLFSWSEAIYAWFQARESVLVGIFLRLGAYIIGAAARIALLLVEASIEYFVAAAVLETIVLCIFLMLGYLKYRDRRKIINFSWNYAVSLFRRGWGLAFSSFLVTFLLQGDRVLLGKFIGAENLGMYAASVRLLDVLLIFPVIYGLAVQRSMFQYSKTTLEHSQAIARIIKIGTWVAIVLAFLGWIAKEWVMDFIFTDRYRGANEIFGIHVWIVVFVTQVSLRTTSLIAQGRTNTVLAITVMSALCYAGAMPSAIIIWGPNGAAICSLVVWGLSALVFPYFVSNARWFGVQSLRSFMPFMRTDLCR